MARPRLYKTHQARVQAAREKRRRHYQKFRESILAKRHQSCKEKKSCQDSEPSDDEDEPMCILHGLTCIKASDICISETLQDCIAAVKYAKDDFMAYVKVPRKFFDLLVDEYCKMMPDPELHPTVNGDKSVFECAITSLEEFLDQAHRGLDGILQMCGVNDKWRAADGVCRFMREMIGMIEDILLHLAEGGDSELVIAFMENELWYQEYKFPIYLKCSGAMRKSIYEDMCRHGSIAVLMRDQRDMLKTFLPAFKIARSGSVEEQEDFWESVYSQWFTTWPERAVHFGEIPHDQVLSGLQEALLIEAIRRRHRGIGEVVILCVHKVRGTTTLKKLRITVLESCLPWLFAYPRLTAVPAKMVGKKWATPEQEEFLLGFMSEFRESAMTKNYDDFFTWIWALWFERWSEDHVIFKDMPDDYVRTPDDIKALARAVETRQQQLVTWYRWQINPARHAHSKGARGMLKFDTVLGRGVELKGTQAPQKIDIYSHKFYEAKVKHAADNAIATENITNRGLKLNKRREITQRMYLEESESVKADIDRKYRKAKASFAKKRQQLKSGKPLKLDDATKVKAIQELGPMLDCILKYLAHIMGRWKFTVLMGGRDPRTGEMSVFNYHVGELQSGAQFNHVYKDFDRMQAAFVAFMQNALETPDLPSPQSEFESTLPHDETAGDEDEESSSDWDSDEDHNDRREKSVEEGMSQVEDLPPFDTSSLYWMTPQSDEILEDHTSSSHTLLDILLDSALPEALPTTASNDASTALGSMTGTDNNSSLATEFLRHLHTAAFDPIIAGTADFSAFNPHAFAAIVNDPYFEPGALDNVGGGDLPAQPPANLTSPDNDCPYLPPSNQEVEVLLPAVPSTNSEEGQDNDSLLNQPEIPGSYTIHGPTYIARPSGSAHGDEHASSPCA
ncbi:hypothetical protein BDR05DRAFT_949333 [Suillus weaverae]|nr:hypothetical protein BDR05DRAFT_949333 [Suillus weaverae]